MIEIIYQEDSLPSRISYSFQEQFHGSICFFHNTRNKDHSVFSFYIRLKCVNFEHKIDIVRTELNFFKRLISNIYISIL